MQWFAREVTCLSEMPRFPHCADHGPHTVCLQRHDLVSTYA